MSDPSPSGVRRVPPELIGALSSIFLNGDGPPGTAIDVAINTAGLQVPRNSPNKAQKVRDAFERAHPVRARKLVEQLVHVIRDRGFIALPAREQELRQLQAAVDLAGGTLTDHGFLTWDSAGASGPAAAPTATAAATPAPPTPTPVVAVSTSTGQVASRPGVQSMPLPTHDRLLNILRRVPAALKPLVGPRRVDQVSLVMAKEYDLQDAVENALRLVYDDVRPEETAPTFAGSATIPDFLLPDVRTAIEIKVTRSGRRTVDLRNEIILDSTTYLTHPDVHRMVFVVYDLVNMIDNPAGFERQLSTPINDHPRDTLVVEWPY
ncbi:hypothetical protein [Microbacterium sp. NPDC078849]|uniref:PD-(D/E)XK nuclease domain-containing protein n=1 Tax=unclassified Microbacterium TaxID=2609290 RepID=UPI003450E2D7